MDPPRRLLPLPSQVTAVRGFSGIFAVPAYPLSSAATGTSGCATWRKGECWRMGDRLSGPGPHNGYLTPGLALTGYT